MLKVKQLSKVFNPNTINENRVFDKLYLDVEQGDFISIIGSNGAGKSTLLNMISGTIEADSGSILLDGS
jgi:putative ABC transport system ATP-binding protein